MRTAPADVDSGAVVKMRGMSPQQARFTARRMWAEMAMQDAKAAERKRYRRKLIATIALSAAFIAMAFLTLWGVR